MGAFIAGLAGLVGGWLIGRFGRRKGFAPGHGSIPPEDREYGVWLLPEGGTWTAIKAATHRARPGDRVHWVVDGSRCPAAEGAEVELVFRDPPRPPGEGLVHARMAKGQAVIVLRIHPHAQRIVYEYDIVLKTGEASLKLDPKLEVDPV